MTDPTISRSAGRWPGRYGRGRATVLLGVVAAAAITAAGCSSPSPRSQPT
ncbi:MAG: hypothetical protein JWL68_1389, partial [Actinomycetia bacterium]|nr:hypothetical protein [Actinomycetes bacterium]